MTYEVFTDYNIDQLKHRVSSAIAKGFIPAGGISITEVHVNNDEASGTINVDVQLLYAQAVYHVNG